MIISPLTSIRAKKAREAQLKLNVQGNAMTGPSWFCKHTFSLSDERPPWVQLGKRVYTCAYCRAVVVL